ncbi:MAG: 30S ribosomal protein S5 [Nitrososphaerales archaeon]
MESAKSVEQPTWVPKTKLGMMVAEGKITSLEQIFENGWKIKEPMIVKTLLPDLKTSVVSVGIVQKQTDAGEVTKFNAIVAVGNENGWLGVGRGKAAHMRNAIEKATNDALLNIIPIRLGCGSWECRCGTPHSIPYKVEGKSGSVKVVIIPGPKGLGLVAGETVKTLLKLAGVKDAWSRTYGSTSTMSSITGAVYDALRQTYRYGIITS